MFNQYFHNLFLIERQIQLHVYSINLYCKITLQFHFGFVGLTLEFNIQQSEYISALAPDAGIRVSIHERGTYPFPEDDGFTVAPGSATSVALKQVVILPRNVLLMLFHTSPYG